MSFLKKILEPSEQDTFDHLTWTGKPFHSVFEGLCLEDVLPSANVGLPSPLIPREPPGPAYVTHTGPLVQALLRRPRPAGPAEPRAGGAPERAPARAGTGTAGAEEGSAGIPKEKSSVALPAVRSRVVFARKPPSTVPAPSNLACCSKRE